MYAIEKAETVKLLEQAGVVYLLVHVEGPSRSPEMAMHYCGAGSEEALALFAFNRSGEVKAPEFVVTRSCWQTIDEADADFHSPLDEHLVGDLEYVASSSAGGRLNEIIDVHVAFDPDHPDAGRAFARRCRLDDRKSPCPP
jgi:hypothetical protein